MIDTRFDITYHAVQRYVQRYAQEATYDQGHADLERLLGTATPLKTKSINGQNLWRVDEPPMLLVVKPDKGRTVLVTVLPSSAVEEGAEYENDWDMVAAYERIKHLVEKPSVTKVEINDALRGVMKEASKEISRLKIAVDQLKTRRGCLRKEISELMAADTKGSSPAKTNGDLVAELNSTKQACAALEKKLERQVVHAKRMVDEKSTIRRALNIAIRTLATRQESLDVHEAIEQILEIEPGLAGLLPQRVV